MNTYYGETIGLYRDSIEKTVNAGMLEFWPQWGYVRSPKILGVVTGTPQDTNNYRVFLTDKNVPVLCRWYGPASAEVVLLKGFTAGCGSKRTPRLEFDLSGDLPEGIRVLSSVETTQGSGYEKWTLILAPRGFAESVRSTLNFTKDGPDNIVVVRDWKPPLAKTTQPAVINHKPSGLGNFMQFPSNLK